MAGYLSQATGAALAGFIVQYYTDSYNSEFDAVKSRLNSTFNRIVNKIKHEKIHGDTLLLYEILSYLAIGKTHFY